MERLRKRLEQLTVAFGQTYEQLGIDEMRQQLADLEQEIARPELWNDPAQATRKNKEFVQLQHTLQPWLALEMQLIDLADFLELSDESLLDEFTGQLAAMERSYDELKQALLFDNPFDNHGAIVRITAGVGGLDAQDFAHMLERMYLRYGEQQHMESSTLERSLGEEGGVKTSVFSLEAPFAYGKLRSEHGVHRLVRLSPFNSDNLRQTSFALVEVLPQIDEPGEVVIDDNDLKIDVYRSGGHGGQSVNTTDSAVRVTHIPTGTVVAIQNERSQLQNKETALKILRSKLAQLQMEQHAATLQDLRAGESASWGAQIRNYVLHPYSLVKDARTKHEEKDVKAVLDGDIAGFSASYLEWAQASKH